MQPSQQQPHQQPSEVQRRVQTPFGEGVVLRSKAIAYQSDSNGITTNNHGVETTTSTSKSTNISMREIQLVWKAKLFSPVEFPSVPLQVGQDVVCQFGRGTILELRETDSSTTAKEGSEAAVSTSTSVSSSSPSHSVVVVVVQLSSWRLAHRSRVTLYLQPNAIQAVVRPKQPWEMNVYEKVEFAQHLKETQANPLFQQQQYAAAWQAYMQAVHVVKFVQHDAQSNNEVRADLVVLMITCCNNAALCAMHLATAEQPSASATPTNANANANAATPNSHKYWEQVYSLANQSLTLLDALYNKRGMKIHSVLTKPSSNTYATTYSDAKLFGEWRVKSLVLMAKTLVYDQLEYDSAIILLKRAHEVLVEYATAGSTDAKDASALQRQDKDVRRLLAFAKDKKRDIKAKEREWAKAMFASPPPSMSTSTSSPAGKKDAAAASPASRKTMATSQPHGQKNGLAEEQEEKKDSASPSANGNKVKAATAAAAAAAHEKKVSFAPDVSFHHNDSSSAHSRGVGKNKKIQSDNEDEIDRDDNNNDEEEEDSFLGQHQEALIIAGSVLVLGLFAVRSLFRHR